MKIRTLTIALAFCLFYLSFNTFAQTYINNNLYLPKIVNGTLDSGEKVKTEIKITNVSSVSARAFLNFFDSMQLKSIFMLEVIKNEKTKAI